MRCRSKHLQNTCALLGVLMLLMQGTAISAESTQPAAAEPQLRMSSGLAHQPASLPPSPAVEDVPGLVRYYLKEHPRLKPPPEAIEAMARYYCSEHPQLPMPAGLMRRMYQYYALENPKVRPPEGLWARIDEDRRRASSHGVAPEWSDGRHVFDGPRQMPYERDKAKPAPVLMPAPDPVAAPDEPVPDRSPEPIPVAEPVAGSEDEQEPIPATVPAPAPAPEVVTAGEADKVPVQAPVAGGAASAATDWTPVAVTQLSEEELKSTDPIQLRAVVSLQRSVTQLEAFLREEFSKDDADAVPGAARPTQLAAANWNNFVEIGAYVRNCPEFMQCDALNERRRFNPDLMSWVWNLSLKPEIKATQDSGILHVEFRGFDKASAAQGEGMLIEAIPVVRLKFRLECDGPCVQGKLKAVAESLEVTKSILGSLQGILISVGAIVALLAGWFGFRRKKTTDAA